MILKYCSSYLLSYPLIGLINLMNFAKSMKLVSWFYCFSLLIFLLVSSWLLPLPAWAVEMTDIETIETTELLKLANRHTQRGNYQQAVKEFTVIVDREPAKTSAYLNRCFAQLQLENYLESLADCSQVIKLNPQAKEAYLAYLHRGLTNYRLGRYPQALIDYDQLISLNSQDFRAYYNRGLAKVGMEDYLGAIEDYNQALNNIPPEDATKIAMVYNDRGLAYFHQANIDQAQADFNHAIALDRRDARTYYNLACICHHQGDWQKAIHNFTLALEVQPEQPDAYLSRAMIYQQLGDSTLAIADLYAAAKHFRSQGQVSDYQATMEIIRSIEHQQLEIGAIG